MFPYLAAAGQNLYVKCGHLYLLLMSDLPNKHPDVHRQFVAGYHSVRQSERYWAGLPITHRRFIMMFLEDNIGTVEAVQFCGGITSINWKESLCTSGRITSL